MPFTNCCTRTLNAHSNHMSPRSRAAHRAVESARCNPTMIMSASATMEMSSIDYRSLKGGPDGQRGQGSYEREGGPATAGDPAGDGTQAHAAPGGSDPGRDGSTGSAAPSTSAEG